MIIIKNQHAINCMIEAGMRLANIFALLPEFMRSGISTLDIDNFIENELRKCNLISQSMGYHGYRHVSCISVNDVVVHGVPRANKIIQDGDLVKVDVCAAFKGYCADMARCYFVSSVIPSENAKKLVDVAYASLDKGIEKAIVGNHIGDISAAIQAEVERNGFGVVRIFAGHGIGRRMHEDPEILNYGKPGKGAVIRPGMAFAIEPMITQGHYDITIDNDGWTARTADKSLAAHVEDTVIVTEHGPRIITRL
jgi:methionyl aminopeptidase